MYQPYARWDEVLQCAMWYFRDLHNFERGPYVSNEACQNAISKTGYSALTVC